MLPVANCKGCTKRSVGCHATCDDYKTFRAELDAINAKKDELNEYFVFRRDVKNLRRHMDHHKKGGTAYGDKRI